ncbi:MAG: fibronectin type III domain-containing protein [Calditrichaeota bacterium]|nr:MAG: fibronectin type III domain-containing protein [Calditrichota bacterium]
MGVGSESVGGQFWTTKSITSVKVSGGTYWVGLYRNPSGGHIFGVNTGANSYRKSNTSSFPSVQSMSGYSTYSNEASVGLFYITEPDDPTSASVSRNSDTSHTISWSRKASEDKPVYTQYIQRWDNVSNSWYQITSITTDYTTNGTHNYTDTTTIANRRYKYRIYAKNTSGNSGYAYTDYIRTTPATPSSVVGTRVGSTVEITWNDNATAETNYTIQRKTSSDNVSWSGWSTLSSSEPADSESYIDNSPANYNQYQVRSDCTDPTLHSSYVASNVVVIIQPPDPPTGLLPDDLTAIDANNEKTFGWTHNTKDSTWQTKYSLKIKKSGGTYPKEIDNFSDYTEWTASGTVALSNDITNAVTGLGNSVGIWDTDNTGSTIYMYKSISGINLTEFDDESSSTTSDLISLLVYITDVSYYSDLTIKLGGDASNCYYTSVNPSTDLVNGWNRIDVAKSAFSTTGYPAWSDITYIRFDVTTENNASGEHISFQYLQLALVTDFANYAGTKFVQYNKISSVTEALTLVANSLVNGNTYEWQVKTWGQATTGGTYGDGSSDWSDTAEFIASSVPAATITDPTNTVDYGYSSLEVDWTYTQPESKNQIQYICKLYSSSDVLLETKNVNSTIPSGNNDTAVFDYVLENSTTYKIKLRVKSSDGLWSDETEVEFDTDFYVPPTPTIELELDEDIGGINITITNPSSTPPEVDAVYNKVYRSIDGGDWELIPGLNEVSLNTTVTDYTCGIGNNNNYYVQAISEIPSSANSSESDLDVHMTGYYFLNGGNGYGDYIKLRGDTSLTEKFGRETVTKKYHGRKYPVKYQSEKLERVITFSCDLPIEDYETLKNIIETIGNHFYRDYTGRWFQCAVFSPQIKDKNNTAYQLFITVERVDNSG